MNTQKFTIAKGDDNIWRIREESDDLSLIRTVAMCPTITDAMFIALALNDYKGTKPSEQNISDACKAFGFESPIIKPRNVNPSGQAGIGWAICKP